MRWWQIGKRDADLGREIGSDLELEEEEQRESGLTPEEARYAARRAFGNPAVIREQTHEAWGWAPVERLWQDIRCATRQLTRSPGFTIVAVLTLGLGIGTTTAIFTLVYDVMLRPLPFAQADRLVTIEEKVAEWSNLYPTFPVSANHFTFWQQNNRTLDSLAVMQQGTAPLGGEGRPLQVGLLSATPGIFSVLQVQPDRGRAFTVSEAQPDRSHVAILMYDLWRQEFGSDTKILGRTIRLNGFPYTVIGVMPRSFHMPSVQTLATEGSANRALPVGVLQPLAFSKGQLALEMSGLNYFGLARLRAGLSVAAATEDLDALQHTISANLPADEKATLSVALTPFRQEFVGNNRKPLLILLVAVGGLLIVGCVNIANLLLARAVGQKQWMAVAAALGAQRAELVRMALREVALLAVAGGGLGVLTASTLIPAMQRYLPPALDFRGALHLDVAGAACALILALLATLLAGAAPAFMISRTAPNEVLRCGTRPVTESRGSRRARSILVGFEAAVSIALLLITGLLTASSLNLMRVDRGFSTERTMTAMIDLPRMSYPDDEHRALFHREVLDRIERLPGVEHAAIASVLPLMGNGWGDIARVAGESRLFAQLPLENFRWVSPEYFRALDLHLVAGRYFTQSDWGRNVALVSGITAKTLWPGRDPVGRQFSRGDPAREKPFTVIGVIADARTISLAKADPMLIYVPYWYRCDEIAGLAVRASGDPSRMADAIRRTIWSVDSSVPVPALRTMGGVVADSVANERFEMDLLLLFAASALFLAGMGVYGVVTYSVAQRSREIGLRIALGAERARIYRLVLRDGLLPVVLGASAGIAIALGASRVIRSLLFQVSPYDPALTGGAVCLLLAAGTIACLLPARRAASVDPIHALRTE